MSGWYWYMESWLERALLTKEGTDSENKGSPPDRCDKRKICEVDCAMWDQNSRNTN